MEKRKCSDVAYLNVLLALAVIGIVIDIWAFIGFSLVVTVPGPVIPAIIAGFILFVAGLLVLRWTRNIKSKYTITQSLTTLSTALVVIDTLFIILAAVLASMAYISETLTPLLASDVVLAFLLILSRFIKHNKIQISSYYIAQLAFILFVFLVFCVPFSWPGAIQYGFGNPLFYHQTLINPFYDLPLQITILASFLFATLAFVINFKTKRNAVISLLLSVLIISFFYYLSLFGGISSSSPVLVSGSNTLQCGNVLKPLESNQSYICSSVGQRYGLLFTRNNTESNFTLDSVDTYTATITVRGWCGSCAYSVPSSYNYTLTLYQTADTPCATGTSLQLVALNGTHALFIETEFKNQVCY